MSALEFISSVAWPVTVLVIALLFRNTISAMLSGELKSLKVGPIKAIWSRNVQRVRSDLQAAGGEDEETGDQKASGSLLESQAQPRTGSGLVVELVPLAEQSPETAVLEAYSRIERTLRELLANSPVDPHLDLSQLGAHALADLAHQHGLISAKTQQAVEGLGVLRNLAAHGRAGELTPERAVEYLVLVDGTLFAMRMDRTQPEDRARA